MLFKLAWRNIWRNKWRTGITMAMIFLAVILSSLMMSIKEGTYVNMIKSMVGAFTGYAQVHKEGYWDDKSVDNSFELTEDIEQKLKTYNKIDGYKPRIESFALASAKEITKGVMIVGFDPEMEQLGDQVKEGNYLNSNDKRVLIGTGLAEYLKLGVGDTLVMIGQGYHGASAAGKYEIGGLIKFGSPEISKQIVFIPLKEAQWFLNAPQMISSIILKFNNRNDAIAISQEVGDLLGEDYEVMDWNELVPEVQQMIDGDKIEGFIFMFILYMVITFGMFGTVLMMLSERRHEFGVLISIGMKRMKLGIVVWMEVLMISILGALIGIAGAFPICAAFYYNPIELGSDTKEMMEEYGMEAVIQASIEPGIWITQGTIVFIIASILALYPIYKIRKINEIDAMRN